MLEAVNLHFKYEEDDYVSAMRTYLMRKPHFIFLFGLVYLLSVVCLLLLFGDSNLEIILFLVCALGLLLGLFELLFRVVPRKKYQREYRFLDEHRLHITEHAIISGTAHDSGALPWKRCTQLLEGKRFYLFEHDQRVVTVIPKRAFKNQEEEDTFRAILRRKLPPALISKLQKESKNKAGGEKYMPPAQPPDWR